MIRLASPPACLAASLALSVVTTGALAEEPHGCDAFKWPVAREQAALAASGLPTARSGESRAASPAAFALALAPLDEAGLAKPPERAPRQAQRSFAGAVRYAAPAAAGLYQVTLSAGAWLDLVQGDRYLKPEAFSGALDCAGVRKTVRFRLAAEPFVLQVSGAEADRIGLVVEPVAAAP